MLIKNFDPRNTLKFTSFSMKISEDTNGWLVCPVDILPWFAYYCRHCFSGLGCIFTNINIPNLALLWFYFRESSTFYIICLGALIKSWSHLTSLLLWLPVAKVNFSLIRLPCSEQEWISPMIYLSLSRRLGNNNLNCRLPIFQLLKLSIFHIRHWLFLRSCYN